MDVIILGFTTAFFVVLLATPSLIKVAKLKHLVDEPGEARKLHSRSIPTIGGIIIFAAILFSYALWFPSEKKAYPGWLDSADAYSVALEQFKYLISSLIILFFVGVKDDIIGTAPVKKLMAHIVVGFILVMMADIRITSMYGIFGVEAIPEWASVLLSVFVYIVIVNAFNLIDGVDGLASGVGLVCSLFFGFWFYGASNIPFALLAFVLGGALMGFLVFNFNPAKIFMGDSGSLIIGVIISVLAIAMIEQDTAKMPESFSALSRPLLAMSILVYPLIDTLRVFIVRAIKGNSPFSADKNHIHHRLIKIGLGHKKTVVLIYVFNVVVVGTAYLSDMYLSVNYALIITVAVALFLIQLPFFIKPKAEHKTA